METLEQAPVIDGVKYVSKEDFERYVFSPVKEQLQLKSGMTKEEIDHQRKDMMSGRRDVTWRNFLLRVNDEV